MEENKGTSSQAVFSKVQMKAIAGVMGDLLHRALQEAKKDASSEDASANQPSGSQGSSTHGEDRVRERESC